MQSSGRLFWDIEQGFRAFQWSAKCCFVEAIISRTKAGRLCYLTECCSPEACMGCGAWQADFGSMWMCLCQKAAMRWFRFLQFLLKPHFFLLWRASGIVTFSSRTNVLSFYARSVAEWSLLKLCIALRTKYLALLSYKISVGHELQCCNWSL